MKSNVATVLDKDEENSSLSTTSGSCEELYQDVFEDVEESEDELGLPVDELICYYGALTSLETQFNERLKEQAERFELLVEETKAEANSKFEDELKRLNLLIEEQNQKLMDLKEKNNALSRHLNYYKKKSKNEVAWKKAASLPLEKAVVNSVKELLESQPRFKMMSNKNIAVGIVKGIFDPEFAGGIVFDELMKQCKCWLRKNVFTPVEILRQMDIRGGTLNYEGLSILNDVEAAAYKGRLKWVRDRVIPTPSSLQRVAEGEKICPFEMIQTPFGEGIEFDYAKVTCLVINSFGLDSIGKECAINISASIDAAKVTKSLSHTSAGLKMTDRDGRDPLKSMKSFLVDDSSFRDLQSRNTIFLMKIILTKETKESFKLFNDIFQFFRLAGCNADQRLNDEKNLDKYDWIQLQDLKPLNVTTRTDMAADWKLTVVGGGVKQKQLFCTLCPLHSDNVHQPNPVKCQQFCHNKPDDWNCYHHDIICEGTKETLQSTMQELSESISLELDELLRDSKIKYYPNPATPARLTNKYSIHFTPTNSDETDDFVDLLVDELVLRGLNPTGGMEELRQKIL
jgi:hypothetical protein